MQELTQSKKKIEEINKNKKHQKITRASSGAKPKVENNLLSSRGNVENKKNLTTKKCGIPRSSTKDKPIEGGLKRKLVDNELNESQGIASTENINDEINKLKNLNIEPKEELKSNEIPNKNETKENKIIENMQAKTDIEKNSQINDKKIENIKEESKIGIEKPVINIETNENIDKPNNEFNPINKEEVKSINIDEKSKLEINKTTEVNTNEDIKQNNLEKNQITEDKVEQKSLELEDNKNNISEPIIKEIANTNESVNAPENYTKALNPMPEMNNRRCENCIDGMYDQGMLECGHSVCEDCIAQYACFNFIYSNPYSYSSFCSNCEEIKKISICFIISRNNKIKLWLSME